MSSGDVSFWQAVLDGAKRIDEEKRKEDGKLEQMVSELNAKMEALIKESSNSGGDGLG